MTYIINGKLIAEELLSSIKKEVKDKFEIIKMELNSKAEAMLKANNIIQ